MRTRSAVQTRLDDIREFRNRIAHHEPIWDRGVLDRYDEIIGAFSWMYPKLALVLRETDEVAPIFKAGPRAFKPLASALVGL
jgi:hypothetical protein